MKRTIVTLLVGLAEKVAALEALVATLQRQLDAGIAARKSADQQLQADIDNIPTNPPIPFLQPHHIHGAWRRLSTYNPSMDGIAGIDRVPPYGKRVPACSSLAPQSLLFARGLK